MKFTPLEHGKIATENLKNIASMQRQNESIQIINDEPGYNYSFINVKFVTIASKPCITVLRDHDDQKLKNGKYLTSFGNIHVKDGHILQIYYLKKWYGIYLGNETLFNKALSKITNK